MRRLPVHLTIIAAILFIACNSFAQNDLCGLKNNSFKDGEKVYYKVFYNMSSIYVHAGDASFTINKLTYEGRNVYHITGIGKTKKSYEWFYKVNDQYETFIDVNTMLPYRFIRNVNEGGDKIYNNITFNHNMGKAISTNGSFSIPQCTQDVLSAIYYARNIDYNKYKPGDKIPFVMFLDDKVYNLYVRYIDKETVKTRFGSYHAIKIAPLLIEGTIFKGGEKMTVWISDDENHIPLRIDSPIIIGSIKVDMIKCEGLRNPLSSAISSK